MRKTTMAFTVLIFVCLVGLMPSGRLDSKSCACVNMTIVKNACAFAAEYVSHSVISGGCNLNSCDITVTVTCKDTEDNNEPYSHDVIFNDTTCKACEGNTQLLNPITTPDKRVGTGYTEFDFMEQ